MNPTGHRNGGFDDDNYLINYRRSAVSPKNDAAERTTRTAPEFNVSFDKINSDMIIEMPAEQYDRLRKGDATVSVTRETQHFCETTTMHGPKRIFKGKRWAHIFWALMVSASLGLLITQVVILATQYLSKPVVSQVSFIIKDGGMAFPLVTFCNFNPVKRSYVEEMNKTGDVDPEMIKYLMLYNVGVQSLVGGESPQLLHQGDETLKKYTNSHPNFTADQFFMNAGFECEEMFKLCTFEGEIFDCCEVARKVATPMGKCFTIDMSLSNKSSMRVQNEPGINSGLQVVLDANKNEQFNGKNGSMKSIFTNGFVDGYRYYIHPADTIPHLSSDEFTVTPNSVAYSAISTDRFVLLPPDQWGNCTQRYPDNIPADLPYSSANCLSLCRAEYFSSKCGCTPDIYNLENRYTECTPYQTFLCVDHSMKDSHGNIVFPNCDGCNIQCNSLIYRSYNSYGYKLSNGALTWLNSRNPMWSFEDIQNNFQIVNIFYRDMSYTEYNQVQDASITQLLSDIGGNMGMFLGMSVITITEICLFFSKVFWIGVSRKRRDYMFTKKVNEKEHQKDVNETVQKMKIIGSSANLKELAKIQSNSSLKINNNDPKEAGDRIQFRINIDDLAQQIDNHPTFNQSNSPKY